MLCLVPLQDPACTTYTSALLNYKGYHAIQSHRIAHVLWTSGRQVWHCHNNTANTYRVCGGCLGTALPVLCDSTAIKLSHFAAACRCWRWRCRAG